MKAVLSRAVGRAPARRLANTVSKSARVALRLPNRVVSRLWNSGSAKLMSPSTMLTST